MQNELWILISKSLCGENIKDGFHIYFTIEKIISNSSYHM